jgi:excisionase family DNA binding protein
MTNLETALRQIISDVVREELRAAFPHSMPRQSADARPRYVSPIQAASIANVSTGAIRIWIRQGRLPVFRAGRVIRISLDALHAFLAPKIPNSSRAHEEEADSGLKRMHEENTTRCQNCGHLPMWHARGECRAKKCTCRRMV